MAAYVLDQNTSARVWTVDCSEVAYFNSANILSFYKTYAPGAYDKTVALGTYHNDGLNYTFTRIKNTIGWEPFKSTFRYFNNLSNDSVPITNLGKLNLFLSKLKDYSGVDVFAMLTTAEKNVYQTKFGGIIQYVSYFTEQEVYNIAAYYIQDYNGTYNILNQRVPLYDDALDLFAYAIPFANNSNITMGHINIGALSNGIAFYLIDPIESNYSCIKTYDNVGWAIKYAIPFKYYCDSGKPNASLSSSAMNVSVINVKGEPFTTDEAYFNEENATRNAALLDMISRDGGANRVAAANTVAQLSSEVSGDDYAQIQDSISSSGFYYGGRQGWWENPGLSSGSRSGKTGDWLNFRGCGAVAFADNILYHIQKDYTTYQDLLKHNDLTKNDSNYSTFSDTFTYYTSYILKSEYIDFLDFYAHMGDIPKFLGVWGSDMSDAYDELENYTNFTYVLHEPSSVMPNDVVSFLSTQLNNDIPVMLHNFLEVGIDTYYDLNDPDQNFDNHWMTITKYFQDGTIGTEFVAFSSWGRRFSINLQLLKTKTDTAYPVEFFYPDFYSYEILPNS